MQCLEVLRACVCVKTLSPYEAPAWLQWSTARAESTLHKLGAHSELLICSSFATMPQQASTWWLNS